MKKMGFASLLLVATLLFALALQAATPGPAAPAPPVPAAPALLAAPPQDMHPHIREALGAMRSARRHLETAAHDFEGHRLKSMEHLDEAIREAEVCLTVK